MSNLQDEFILFIQMLLDDESKQRWFLSLATMSDNARTIELRNMAVKMAHANEDESVVRLIASLPNVEIYNSIRAVLLAELNQKK